MEAAGPEDEEFAFSDDEAEAAYWQGLSLSKPDPSFISSPNPAKRKERDAANGNAGRGGGSPGGRGGGRQGPRGGQTGGRGGGGSRGRARVHGGGPRGGLAGHAGAHTPYEACGAICTAGRQARVADSS